MLDRMRRFTWSLGFALLLASAGCGLVLDASARTDASISDDARGIDAAIDRVDAPIDGADAPATGLDAQPDLDAFENVLVADATFDPGDAAATELDAHLVSGDAASSADAVAPRDAPRPTDALLTTPDGSRPVDGGRDAPMCSSSAECPATSTLASGSYSCQARACSAGTCLAVGPATLCPPAGTCGRPCEFSDGSGPTCVREGMRCASLGQACDRDLQCLVDETCAPLSGCRAGVCLPACEPSELDDAVTVVIDGATVTMRCDGSAFVPDSYRPAWCSP